LTPIVKTRTGEDPSFHARTSYRLVCAAFGLCLVGAGPYVLLGSGTTEWPRVAAGFVLVVIGGNMLVAAPPARRRCRFGRLRDCASGRGRE
jgi:hypothetical protein